MTADKEALTMADETDPAVVIVRVPTPRFAPAWLVRRKMAATTDLYRSIHGLDFKVFTIEAQSGDFGGVYSWRSRAEARAWFNEEWFQRVRRERGSEPSVRTFSAPLTIDNVAGGTPAARGGRHVVTLVEIPILAGVTTDLLREGFLQAEADYRAVPGLLRKHFIVSESGTFGGVYLWDAASSADAWFDDAWHARVVERYGAPASIERFAAPILLPSDGR